MAGKQEFDLEVEFPKFLADVLDKTAITQYYVCGLGKGNYGPTKVFLQLENNSQHKTSPCIK